MLHFSKDWWKFMQIHQYCTMALISYHDILIPCVGWLEVVPWSTNVVLKISLCFYFTLSPQTKEITLRRNGLGQLGFHVHYQGIVVEVDPYGFAWQAGLRKGARLVEVSNLLSPTYKHLCRFSELFFSYLNKHARTESYTLHQSKVGWSKHCHYFACRYWELVSCIVMHTIICALQNHREMFRIVCVGGC